MSKKKKPTIPFESVTPEMRAKIALWLDDSLHDMEVDADHIAEERGTDFLPSWRGLVAFLRGGQ